MARRKRLYVAYGSNLNIEQMSYRCPYAKVFGTGVLKNYSLTFWGNGGGRGVATVLPGADTDVPVAVWEITAADEKNLDVYEGWPHLYRKEMIDVLMSDGSTVSAMIYLMNPGHRPTFPSEYYYNVIASGYNAFGFDTAFLDDAVDALPVNMYGFKKFV